MTEYTAKEVFAEANRHGDHVADMLTAYAERIAADERVVPVAEVGRDWTLHWVGHGPIAPIITQNNIRIGDKLFPHPPAQAAKSVDVEKVREVIVWLRSGSMATTANAGIAADKLEAALPEKGNG